MLTQAGVLKLSLNELNDLPLESINHYLGFSIGHELAKEKARADAERKAALSQKHVTW